MLVPQFGKIRPVESKRVRFVIISDEGEFSFSSLLPLHEGMFRFTQEATQKGSFFAHQRYGLRTHLPAQKVTQRGAAFHRAAQLQSQLYATAVRKLDFPSEGVCGIRRGEEEHDIDFARREAGSGRSQSLRGQHSPQALDINELEVISRHYFWRVPLSLQRSQGVEVALKNRLKARKDNDKIE